VGVESGRLVRSAEEVSRLAVFTDRTEAGPPGSFIDVMSYYQLGAAIALSLDLSLRERSNGRLSLDDFMREMWRRYGKPGGVREGYVDRPYTAADAEATAMSRDEQITRRYEIQMAALQIEIEQKRAALEERGAAWNDMERTHHAELSRLRAESQEKHTLLENRNEEFVGVKNAMESLCERLTQGEATAAHAEQAAAEDRERLRGEYEAQLAALRQELSERERSDKDQGAVETAQTKPGQTVYSRSDRRWRSSGGWKRRWKT